MIAFGVKSIQISALIRINEFLIRIFSCYKKEAWLRLVRTEQEDRVKDRWQSAFCCFTRRCFAAFQEKRER